MSLRASTGSPRACSGDMYAVVPMTMPGVVCAPDGGHGFVGAACGVVLLDLREAEVHELRVAVLAQHDVLGLHVAVHDARRVRGRQRAGHLAGDLDRVAQRQARGLVAAAGARSRSRSVWPSMNSVTRNGCPSTSSTSWMVRIDGWFSADAAFASCVKRRSRSAIAGQRGAAES